MDTSLHKLLKDKKEIDKDRFKALLNNGKLKEVLDRNRPIVDFL